ncbi:MAG: ribonuclease H-like domain-containing protein, partial [Verrucomicrobiota bacterium]
MIDQALLHLPGIGPERQAVLHRRGIRTWRQIAETIEDVPRMGARAWKNVRNAAGRNLQALETNDLHTLVCELRNEDHWRLLGNYLEQATFFDIETTGLTADSQVTVVVCRHRNRLHTFVRGRNLEEFLDLLDEVDLLASFNGSSFDVPRVTRLFNIPAIP